MLAINDPITLVVALDRNVIEYDLKRRKKNRNENFRFQFEAKGEIYLDDGQTYNYRHKRQFIHRRFTFRNNELYSKWERRRTMFFLFYISNISEHSIQRVDSKVKFGSNVFSYSAIRKIRIKSSFILIINRQYLFISTILRLKYLLFDVQVHRSHPIGLSR